MTKKRSFKGIFLIFLILVFCLSSVLIAQPARSVRPSSYSFDGNTIQLWGMDQFSNQTIDGKTAGAALQGKVSNGCSIISGRIDNAMRFDGTQGRIQLPDNARIEFGPRESFTVDLWIKVFKQGQTQQIFSTTPVFEMEVRQEHGGISFNLKAVDGSDATARCTGLTDVTDGRWHYVGVVRNTRLKKLQVFIDGILDGEVEDATFDKKVIIAGNGSIGGRADGREMLNGFIDNIRISKGIRKFREIPGILKDASIKEYILENKMVRLEFKSQAGQLWLNKLTDKLRKSELMQEKLPSRLRQNIWQVSMKSDKYMAVLNERPVNLNCKKIDTDDGKMLKFTWSEIPIEAKADMVDILVTVFLPDDSAFSEWKIDVTNKSKDFGAWIVKFPFITNIKKLSTNGANDYLAIPGGNGGGAGEGQLFKDPFKTLHTMIRTYPCYHQSMQFNAYYGTEAGLYLATYDGQSNLKGFLIKPMTDGGIDRMSYEVQNYPADSGVSGTGFKQDYPAIVAPFSGDWYDASRIYRKWALTQKWCKLGQTWQRDDLAPSLKKGSYWMMYALDFEPHDKPFMRKLARTLPVEEVKKRSRSIDVEKSLANLREAYEYFDYPLIVWVNSWWEGGGDYSPPRYIPMKNLELLLERIHKEFPGVKLNGHIQPKRYSIQCLEYNDEVEKSLEIDGHGDLAIGPVQPRETNDRHAYPCWATKFWQNFWVNKSYDSALTGMDGFHVDELGSATSFDAQCFNRAHGHPIGGGTLYADTRRNMISIIRDNARRANPEFAAHHEVLCEIYVDVADLAEVCTTPSNINIPMYEAVYHDYNFIMGRRITKWHDRNLWHKGDEPGDEGIEEFVASFGQTYIWGNQPGWTRVDIVSYAPKVAAIIKRFMDSRYRAMKFLHYGDMMRPLIVTKPLPMVKTIWRMCDTPEHIMPAVINSVWKAPNEDSVGIVLVNITDKPQNIEYQCDLNECGLKAENYTITRIDKAKPQDLGLYKESILSRSDTLEPQSVKIIEIKPTS